MKSSRTLDKLFEEAHDDLAILVTRTRQLRRWTTLFRSRLDEELAPHCYLSNLDGPALTVYVHSAAWATRLRFQAPNLIPDLRATNPVFASLETIRVKVLAPDKAATVSPTKSAGPAMSKDNAQGINTLSESIEDPELQQALQRLAKNALEK